MLDNGEKLILKPFGGCGDGWLCQKAFAALGHKAVYSTKPEMIEQADLIYLPGGADVDPSRYGGDPKLSYWQTGVLDRWEVEVTPKALALDIPIFGVCRGHQALWVELGGRLEQHITPRHSQIRMWGGHLVAGERGEAVVNSMHHQAPHPDRVPDGAKIRMLAPDGTIEAYTYGKYAVGVQWHPEMLPHDIWMYLMIAAIQGEADRIPQVYGRKELPDDFEERHLSPRQMETWSDRAPTIDADGRVWSD